MSLKNLSAKNKANNQILSHLNNKKIFKIFKEFSLSLNNKEKLAVAVSGGPDSLSLAFLAKCFSIKNKIKVKYLIVDHKIRKESSHEAKVVKKILKMIDAKCSILKWNGKKPSKNIQSIARDKRYSLLSNTCKKNKIKNLLLGHHLNDLSENFLIRIIRGSGLNGLISFDKRTKYKNEELSIIRPLINIEKKDLIYISKKVFNFFVEDPSNKNPMYKRTRVRNFLQLLEKEGFDKKKLILTINNLKDTDKSIKFYVEKNLIDNVIFLKKQNTHILGKNFFNQSHEVIFRSITKIILNTGGKKYPVRGKSVTELIRRINDKSFSKVTLGGCFIDRINETLLITKEK